MTDQYQLIEEVAEKVRDASNDINPAEVLLEAIHERDLFIGSVPPIGLLHEADLDVVERLKRALALWDGVELDTTMVRALLLLMEQQGLELQIGMGEEEEDGQDQEEEENESE